LNDFHANVSTLSKPSPRPGKGGLLDNRLDLGTDVLSSLVHLHKLGDVELGLLEDLNLPDVDVLDGENSLALLLNLLSHDLGEELLDELLEVALGSLLGHDLGHLGADLLLLSSLDVAGLLELVGHLLGEGDAEHADEVSVGGADVDGGLDDGLPFLDETAKLVAGHVHAVEVGEDVVALDLLSNELDLPEALLLVSAVEVGEGELEDTSAEALGGNLGSLGLGDEGLSSLTGGEETGGLDGVPLLHGEGVYGLPLSSLLGLCETLVLSDSHVCSERVGGRGRERRAAGEV
jgi:hypothetical protein